MKTSVMKTNEATGVTEKINFEVVSSTLRLDIQYKRILPGVPNPEIINDSESIGLNFTNDKEMKKILQSDKTLKNHLPAIIRDYLINNTDEDLADVKSFKDGIQSAVDEASTEISKLATPEEVK